MKIYTSLERGNVFIDGGEAVKGVGGAVEMFGLAVAVFAPPAGGLIASTGVGIQASGHALVIGGELQKEGKLSNSTKIDAGVDLAFAIIPKPFEALLDKLELDKGTKALLEAQAKEKGDEFVKTEEYIKAMMNIGFEIAEGLTKDALLKKYPDNDESGPPSFDEHIPDDIMGNN